jgi:hypothetical protein
MRNDLAICFLFKLESPLRCFRAGTEYFRSHVAARFGPLVVLLGEHGADQADDRAAVREDAHDVGAPPDLLVQPLAGYLELSRQP